MPRRPPLEERVVTPPGVLDDEDEDDDPLPPSKPPPKMHGDDDHSRLKQNKKQEHTEEEEQHGSKQEVADKPSRRKPQRKKTFSPDQLSGLRLLCFRFLTWPGFDTVMGIIILLNGFTIGYETQTKVNTPMGCNENCVCTRVDAVCQTLPEWAGIMEYCFSFAYLVELVLRVIVYGPRIFVDSAWVRLDLFLVLSSLTEIILNQLDTQDLAFIESVDVDLLRMLRLARLARAVRLIALFKTLWLLVQGLMHSVNTLLWTTLLTAILIYIFAIIGLELITIDQNLPLDHPYNIAVEENFRDLADASMMLLQCFSWDSISGVYRPLIKQRFQLFFYFITVLLVMSIALMNLVTAIMVEGSLEQGNEDKAVNKKLEAEKKLQQIEELKKLFLELDEDGSGELSMEEIDAAPEAMREQLIDIAGTEDIASLFEMLDYDGGGTLAVDEFCDGILKATNSDKPMELDRLVKQCGDIFANSRATIKMLRGQDPDAQDDEDEEEGNGGEEDDDEGSPPPPKDKPNSLGPGEVSPQVASFVDSLEGRICDIERTIVEMQNDVQHILGGMLKINCASRSHTGVKKAVAVCRGPITSKMHTVG